jgi:hypothetical protein
MLAMALDVAEDAPHARTRRGGVTRTKDDRMKNEMMGKKRRGVFSKGLITALLVLPMGLAASCAMEPDETSNDEQALTGNCTVKHPYAWTSGSSHCRESFRHDTQTVENGDTFEAEAVANGLISGDGRATVGCNNGVFQKTGTLNGVLLSQTCSGPN